MGIKYLLCACSLFAITLCTCSCQTESKIAEDKYYGVYRAEYENTVDTLILNRDSTFYHSYYVDGKPVFKQTATFYVKNWAILREYREDATVKNGGWDMVAFYDNVTGEIKVAIDRDMGVFYTKIKDY